MFLKCDKTVNNKTLDADKGISNSKLIILFCSGILGLYFFALIAQVILQTIPTLTADQISGLSNFIAYGLLFVLLIGILGRDVKKILSSIKSWRPIVIGIIIGFTMIAIQMGYTNIVNLFYPINVSDNETSLRSFISLYPALSIIILCFIGPACEEIIYRVGLFGFFSKRKVLAFAISILVFALMHFNPFSENIINELINLPLYLISAFILTFTYYKFGFFGSYVTHCVNNLWSVIGILIIYGIK